MAERMPADFDVASLKYRFPPSAPLCFRRCEIYSVTNFVVLFLPGFMRNIRASTSRALACP
jgi:hypothetical protein